MTQRKNITPEDKQLGFASSIEACLVEPCLKLVPPQSNWPTSSHTYGDNKDTVSGCYRSPPSRQTCTVSSEYEERVSMTLAKHMKKNSYHTCGVLMLSRVRIQRGF